MRLRLIISFTLVVLITIASLIVIVRLNTAQTVRSFMFRGGVAGVENLVEELEDHYHEKGSWQEVNEVFHAGHGMMGPGRIGMNMGSGKNNNSPDMIGQHLRLVDTSGNIVFDNHGNNPGEHLDDDELTYAIALSVDGQDVGYLIPESNLQFTLDNEQELLSRLNRSAFFAALIAGSAALILALILSYQLIRPVRDLRRAATLMADGDLGQRVVARGGGELNALGEAFNSMAASLQQAGERRRALTADIAHELRTPLAVQRAHLEALQDGIYDLTLESLIPVEEQNHALTRLVEDLRTLALVDAGELTLEKTQVDYPDLVQRVVHRSDLQAAARQINLVLSPMNFQLNLHLDPQRIEQIINNLLNNAMRFTPQGGSIFVEMALTDGQAILTIRDTGPGIPKASLDRIFDRFYKVNKSRQDEAGTGLGLSIAQKLARAHRGELSAGNHPQGGAIFTLSLPRTVASYP